MKLLTKAQTSLNTVVEKFKKGDLSAVVKIAHIRRDPGACHPVDHWPFNNQVLALMQTGSVDCRGFRQWKQAGRSVKKGERAAYILGPCTYTVEDENGEEKTILKGFTDSSI